MLIARFIIRIRAYSSRSEHGHASSAQNVSTFVAETGQLGQSFVDEFGEDPVAMARIDDPLNHRESGAHPETIEDVHLN